MDEWVDQVHELILVAIKKICQRMFDPFGRRAGVDIPARRGIKVDDQWLLDARESLREDADYVRRWVINEETSDAPSMRMSDDIIQRKFMAALIAQARGSGDAAEPGPPESTGERIHTPECFLHESRRQM